MTRADPPATAIVQALLHRHGRTYASDAGIRLDRNTPSPLFRLLCLSLLISARIDAGIAMKAAHALVDAGWTTADKLSSSTWEQRTAVLNRAGYARYDESTSRYLASTTETVLDRYDGDLRALRADADGDVDVMGTALQRCKGIGGVGASFFIREVQTVWHELNPFIDDRAAQAATSHKLPSNAEDLRELVESPQEFTRLVAALVRSSLADTHKQVLEDAAR